MWIVEDSQKICGLMFEVAELWKRCQGDRTVENMWEAEELWNNFDVYRSLK
jgi:hypothetical protein